jgi:Transposase DDE domain group 1
LSDSRQGSNKQFTLADLLRQSVYSHLAGYEGLNDAKRLAADPTFRLISSQRIWDWGAALTSTLHWFETELLTQEENLLGLMALNRQTLGQAECLDNSDRVVIDMDASESPVQAEQEGSAYNGTSNRSATTRCFCSIVTGIACRRSCVRAMCTAPKAAMNCCCRRLSVQQAEGNTLLSGRTRLLPNRKSMKRWRSGA